MQISYQEWLKKDLDSLIDAIELSDTKKHFLRSRWLENVLWMERKAGSARVRHYVLRLVSIIGGVIVPTLVSLNLSDKVASEAVRWLTFTISLLVAISVAVEGFLRYGERWRHYRRTVELLKIEGWQFFQLSGPYRTFEKHADIYPLFAGRVEETIQREVDEYITQVVKEEKEEKKKE